MPTELIGLTLQTIGSVFVAYAALRVHHRVLNEHSIDKKVFLVMRREQIIGWAGVGLLIAGYAVHLVSAGILL